MSHRAFKIELLMEVNDEEWTMEAMQMNELQVPDKETFGKASWIVLFMNGMQWSEK
jgi:hypothetical protein